MHLVTVIEYIYCAFCMGVIDWLNCGTVLGVLECGLGLFGTFTVTLYITRGNGPPSNAVLY